MLLYTHVYRAILLLFEALLAGVRRERGQIALSSPPTTSPRIFEKQKNVITVKIRPFLAPKDKFSLNFEHSKFFPALTFKGGEGA